MKHSELKQLMLHRPRLTLAVAESMTCGRVQAKIGEISGASEFFLGGITTYTLDEKVRHLGVGRAGAWRTNCVSPEVVAQMAKGVCALFDADLGVATTGYAEPSPKNRVAAPFAWWALAHRRRGKFRPILIGRVECFGARRIETQGMVADAVVTELVAYLDRLRSGAGL